MTDITTIPEKQLRSDLEDSRDDIAICEAILKLGITKYSGGSIWERRDGNKQFVEVIEAELARREKGAK